MAYYYGFRPYVSVARRRADAIQEMAKLRNKGMDIQPIRIDGRTIAKTFWGKAWCDHLEKFSDFENRLPRGRTYVRNGSVCHLGITKGQIVAKVSGSDMYDIEISIKPLDDRKWTAVKECCAGQIGSMLELLQGKLSDQVMGVVTDTNTGLFPSPEEIKLDCSCPDYATMCKHVAAVMYGIGARLDQQPELLFVLRGVNHTELVSTDAAKAVIGKGKKTARRTLAETDISEVFGIDVTADTVPAAPPPAEIIAAVAPAGPPTAKRKKKAAKKTKKTKATKTVKIVTAARKRSPKATRKTDTKKTIK